MDKYTYRFLQSILDEEQQDQLQAYLLMNGDLVYDVQSNKWKVKNETTN